MAVVTRNRKSGAVYYVANAWQGRQASERVGESRREAEIRDRAMKREIAEGTYQPPSTAKATTLGEYAEAWGSTRRNASAGDERRCLRLYLAPRRWLAGKRLDEVKPTDVDRWVSELKNEEKLDGSRRLSDKTIANAVGVLRQLYGQAIREDRCVRQPVTLAPGILKRRPASEPETYTAAEALVLTRHHAIPWPIRVLNALCLFSGLREGEACGRRWRDLDGAPSPLPALTVRDQYDGRPLKTERPRVVPVHPELGSVLTDWAREGFELFTGRKPEPDDFIVPHAGPRALRYQGPHTRSSFYKAFVRSAGAAGIRARSLHATRHTFVSLCRRGGARPDVLERVTHNASGKIIDRYTHFDWAPLCEAVLCLRLDVHPNVHPPGGTAGELDGAAGPLVRALPDGSALDGGTIRGSIPGASTNKHRKNGPKKTARQAERQDPKDLTDPAIRRRRRLRDLKAVDPDAARPGLALCRGLTAALVDDQPEVDRALAEAARALGGVGG